MENIVGNQVQCMDLMELLPDGVCIHQNGVIVYINKNGAKNLGYEHPGELLGQNVLTFVHPTYREMVFERIKKVLSESVSVPFIEEKLINKKGEIIDVEVSATPCSFNGQPAVLTVTRDIRGRKKTQQMLEEKEERHRKYFGNSLAAAFVANELGQYTDVNDAACRLLGYSKEELLNLSIPEITATQDLEGSKNSFAGLKQRGKLRTERTLVKKDGTPIEVEVNSFKVFDNEYMAICYDVTERKKAEKALRESEYRYRIITENTLDLITLTDPNCTIKYASPSHKNLLGYEPQYMLDKSVLDLVHPDDLGHVNDEIFKATAHRSSGKVECRIKNANNNYIWMEIIGNVLLDSEGQIEGAVFCSRDIGERKFSEKMLKDSEERYRRLVEFLPDGVLIVCQGKIVFANKAAKNLLRINNDKTIIGRNYKSIIDPYYWESFLETVVPDEEQNTPLKEGKFIKDSGESIDVEIAGTPFTHQAEPAELIVFRDITQRKKAEENLEETRKVLFEKEKLALIGQMSAGIAHEIRNPLTTIRGYTQLLKMKEYDKAKVDSYADIMIAEIDRVNGLISDFLQLARPKEPNLEKQHINQLLTEFFDLFMPQALFNNIEVSYETEDNMPECLFDKNQIKQVLLNLAKNAIDAMPNGGKLKIVSGYKIAENQVFVCIEDNGCGIPPAIINQLGLPFFSSKDKGAGLGLSMSYAIIRAHGGKIEVESVEGKGSKFTLFLPAAQN